MEQEDYTSEILLHELTISDGNSYNFSSKINSKLKKYNNNKQAIKYQIRTNNKKARNLRTEKGEAEWKNTQQVYKEIKILKKTRENKIICNGCQTKFNNKHTYIKHVKESLLDIKKYNIVLPKECLDPEDYTIEDNRQKIKNSIQQLIQDKNKKDTTHNQYYNTKLYKLSNERFKYKKDLQNIDDKINQIIHLKKLNREKCDKCKKHGFFPIKCGCPNNHKFCEGCYDDIQDNNSNCPICEHNIVCDICPICYKVKNNRLIEWCENKHKFCIGCYHILSQKNIESCPYCRSSRI